MNSKTLDMGKRYNELRAAGKTGKEAAQIIQSESGTTASLHSIMGYGSNARKRKEHSDPSYQAEHSYPSQDSNRDEHSERSKDENHSYYETCPPSEERMRQIALEVFEEMHRSIPEARQSLGDRGEWPPAPTAINRRKQAREYLKISVTVDKTLWALFQAERGKLDVSSGRLLDRILWLYYGKPALSYERSEASDQSESPEHSLQITDRNAGELA